jgi:hypothetical protein
MFVCEIWQSISPQTYSIDLEGTQTRAQTMSYLELIVFAVILSSVIPSLTLRTFKNLFKS